MNAYVVYVDVTAALDSVGRAYEEIAQGLADRLMEALAYFQALGFESARIDWRYAASLLPFSSIDASIRRFRRGRRSPQPAPGQFLGPVEFSQALTAPAVMASRRPRELEDDPIGGVARASNGRVLFFLDGEPNTVPNLRDAATGRSPLVAHEFFHLVQQGYAPTLSSSLALAGEPVQSLVPSYLRWFSEGTATAAGVSKYVYDLGDGTGYDPRLVRGLESTLGSYFPSRGWGARIDGPYARSAGGQNPAYALGSLFFCADLGKLTYLKSMLCGVERWLATNSGPNLLAKVQRGEFVENVISLFEQANLGAFQPAALANGARVALTGFQAAFARTIFAVGQYRGVAEDEGTDDFGNRMYEVRTGGDFYQAQGYWPIGGGDGDVLGPIAAVSRAYFPQAALQGMSFEFLLPNTWPEGFVLMVSVGANNDEGRVWVLRSRGDSVRIPLGDITAANPVHVSVMNLRFRSGANAFTPVAFRANLRVV